MALGATSESTDPVELTSGIDALYLSGRGSLPGELLSDLEQVKAEASSNGTPVEADLGGYDVRVLGSGWGKYRYCVEHELARIGFTSSESLPAVRVQPTSLAIHSLGAEGTVLWVRNLLDAAGIVAALQVARLDLHADWQGLWIDADERANFVTYSNKRALYEVGEDLSGLNFGKRGAAIYARIYDKTRELEGKGDDWWLDLWGPSFNPEQRVLRVEFEFNRDGLREFSINTPEDAFDQLGALWGYATGVWLSLRVPCDDETRSRWPVDSRWQAIQRATIAGTTLPAARLRAGEAAGRMRLLLPQLVGYLTGAALPLGTSDLFDTLDALVPCIVRYEAETGLSFADRVSQKRRR
jgi:hypothetical protein